MNSNIESLAPAQTYSFEVMFSPETIGKKSAVIFFNTNFGNYTIELVGDAIEPEPIVYIPDANFKASLLNHGLSITGEGVSIIDTNNDGEIQLSEAESYTGIIKCHNAGISNLSGIEAFKFIEI